LRAFLIKERTERFTHRDIKINASILRVTSR